MNMKKKKWLIPSFAILIFFVFGLTACGAGTAEAKTDTPEEVLLDSMEALKELDLDAFNARTDNYVRTHRNWIGIPTQKEYRIFNELQQPGLKGKRYRSNKKFADKIVQNLSWEIKDVQVSGKEAQIDMTVTNIDMSDVMGKYEISIMEDMISSDGTGLISMIRDIHKIDYGDNSVVSIMEQEEGLSVLDITVGAYKEDGIWKFHVSDSFINAVMGNMDSEHYSDEIQNRLDELEKEYEYKLDQWEDDFFE